MMNLATRLIWSDFQKALNAPAAHNALEQLRFAKAKNTHNIASYQSYLGQYAVGKYALQARNQIDQFSFKKARDKQTTAAYKKLFAAFSRRYLRGRGTKYTALFTPSRSVHEPR